VCARAYVITEFEDSEPSFKNSSEDDLKLHLREVWELMYSKLRQHAPSIAATLVSRVIRRIPLSDIRQLLLDGSFVFSADNINQVLKKYVDTGDDVDEPLVEDATDEHEGSDDEDDEDDEDGDEDSASDEDDDPRMRYM
jgi:hypothetical protein